MVELTDGERVEHGADDGEEQDGAEVVEEEPVGHEVAGVEDDGRQHAEEEDGRRQRRQDADAGVEEPQAEADADDYQHARFGNERRQSRNGLVTWTKKKSI